jgi:hypothetical protein
MVLLSGCTTFYQPSGLLGGNSETRLSADSCRVLAEADTEERAGQMLELRAAELTQKAGYQKFIILKKNVRTETWTRRVSGPRYVMAVPTAGGGFSGVRTMPPSQQLVSTQMNLTNMLVREERAQGRRLL